MVEAIIGLGSNLGDKEENLRRAIVGMTAQKTMRPIEMPSIYETEPMYYENQDRFLNCVVAMKTDLKPWALL